MFSFVFISQKLASEMAALRYVLTLTGLFSLFLYSQELQQLGNRLMRRERKSGESRDEAALEKANREKHDDRETNPWGSSLDKLKEWDPKGAELLLRVGTNPWTSGVLPRKEVELIYLALNCSCTNLDEAGTRRQIRAALDAGATRDEILLVLKCGVGVAVHSCSLGAPILLEEMKAAE